MLLLGLMPCGVAASIVDHGRLGVVVVRDTRLVQTAVIGDEHSDVPIVLPTEAIELDGFRRSHAHDTFWCGLLLGGCGARLAHKLYVDRQCHFQHFPQANGAPHACQRPKVGESSADHLYVKLAMTRSLLEHGRTGSFAFPQPIGSLLDVDLEDGVLLRVHMDGAVPPAWDDGRIPVLGPGVVPEPGVLSRCPHVYRVRCESDGSSRQVWIGTQSLAHPTEWVPLADCSWTDDGLITPAATEILRQHPSTPGPSPVGVAAEGTGALPENVIRFIRGLEAAQRSGTVEHVRRLYAGSGPFLKTLTGPHRSAASPRRSPRLAHRTRGLPATRLRRPRQRRLREAGLGRPLPAADCHDPHPAWRQRLRAACPGRSPRLPPQARPPPCRRRGPHCPLSPSLAFSPPTQAAQPLTRGPQAAAAAHSSGPACTAVVRVDGGADRVRSPRRWRRRVRPAGRGRSR